MKRKNIKEHGITLVALVITIVVLIILAAVTINLSLGNSSIFNRVTTAAKDYTNKMDDENKIISEYHNDIKELTFGTRNTGDDYHPCNPKLLLTLSLASSNSGTRAVGTYYASSSFTETTTDDYSSYMTRNEQNKWVILKSGYYAIDSFFTIHWKNSSVDGTNYIYINDAPIVLNREGLRAYDYDIDEEHVTYYLEENTVIDFSHCIGINPSAWNSAYFNIYAMFQ